MTSHRQSQGEHAEQAAAFFLEEQGYRILERNYRCPLGEIDIIAQQDDTLAFVEVRSLANATMAQALASVRPPKQQRIFRTAQHYLFSWPHDELPPLRFDLVGVIYHDNGNLEFRLLPAAFAPS